MNLVERLRSAMTHYSACLENADKHMAVIAEAADRIASLETLTEQLETTAASYKQQVEAMAMERDEYEQVATNFMHANEQLQRDLAAANAEIERLKGRVKWKEVAEDLQQQLHGALSELERVEKDAENWRKYQERKRQLIEGGLLKSPLRNGSAMSAMKEDGK